MEENAQTGAFDIPDLWRPSLLSASVNNEAASLFQPLNFDYYLPLLPGHESLENLKLPALENFHYGSLELSELSEGSVISTELENADDQDVEEEDIWILAGNPQHCSDKLRFVSWETFQGDDIQHKSPYLSEWPRAVFDAALGNYGSENAPIIDSQIGFRSMLYLGLGRCSHLYEHTKYNRLERIPVNFTISGFSKEMLLGLEKILMNCGNSILLLQEFTAKKSFPKFSPAHVALASSIETAIFVLETHLTHSLDKLRSWSQLEVSVLKLEAILLKLLELTNVANSTKSDEELLSIIFQNLQNLEHDLSGLKSMIFSIFVRCCTSFIERLDNWIGLNHDSNSKKSRSPFSFIQVEKITSDNGDESRHFELAIKSLPSFLSLKQGQVILETGKSLQLIKTLDPQHTLLTRTNQHHPSTRWISTWSEVDEVIQTSQNYETNSMDSIIHGKNPSHIVSQKEHVELINSSDLWLSHLDTEEALQISINHLNQKPETGSSLPDELYQIILDTLDDQHSQKESRLNVAPPISLLSQLSMDPLLNAQSRLIQAATIRLLYHSGLRDHLSIQKSFHLMGNGVFVSRICAALFDSEMPHSTEREPGVMRSGAGTGMGLKLSERRSWPPASSELRLALAGILGICYNEKLHENNREIPGNMSFSIRNLPESEIERILDRDSLYALDFLRLQYHPPSPIDEVITQASIEKYDTVFKFLLRLQRMQFTVSRLPVRSIPSIQRQLQFQARNFVNSCSIYFFDHIINTTWSKFQFHIDAIDQLIAAKQPLDPSTTISSLCNLHNKCIEEIQFGLFLRQRHVKIASLLQDIFGIILKVPNEKTKNETYVLKQEFEDKVKLFLEVCRGLAEKKHSPVKAGAGNGAELSILINLIDGNGYYDKTNE